MRRLLCASAVLLSLGACGLTPQGDVVRGVVLERGKIVAAQTLENNENYMCRVSPVGAVKDRYGQDEAKAEAYNTICDGQEGVNIISPENP